MALGDVLDTIGSGLKKTAQVAGAVLPVAGRVIGDVADPDVAAERVRRQQQLEDEGIKAQADQLQSQLNAGVRYGTLTPEQQQDLGQQIIGLHNHPRHAPMLMDRLRQIVHPNGAVAQGPMSETLGLPKGLSAYPSEGTYQFEQNNKAFNERPKSNEVIAQNTYTMEHFGVPFEQATADQQGEAFRKVGDKRRASRLAHTLVIDPDSPSGFSSTAWDMMNGEVFSTLPNVTPPRGFIPTHKLTISKDQFGNETSSVTTIEPQVPGKGKPTPGPAPMPASTMNLAQHPDDVAEEAQAPKAAPKKPAPKGTAAAALSTPPSAVTPSPATAPAPTVASALTTSPTATKPLDANGNIPEADEPNPQVRELANEIIHGRDPDSVPPKGKPKAVALARAHGWNESKTELTQQAQQVLLRTQPVLDQVDRLVKAIDGLKLGDNNTPAYLLAARTKYALGIASPEGSLGKEIAGLSLGSLVEATSALTAQGGGSRSLPALKIALDHTPNPWKDSPQMIKEKLLNIKERLNDVVNEVKTEGTKHYSPNATGTQPPPATTTTAPAATGPLWSKSKFAAAHPNVNIDAAVKEAVKQGRRVVD